MKETELTYGRISAGLMASVVMPLLALALDQSDVVEIPWVAGAVVVILIAGFCSGLLLRSLHAATYMFALWAIWAGVALYTDTGRYDPPAEVAVFSMLFLLIVPAALAAMAGVLVVKVWQSRVI